MSSLQLRSFNLSTYELISSVDIAEHITLDNYERLIRWGEDGLAFTMEGGHIVLVSGPFVSEVAL